MSTARTGFDVDHFEWVCRKAHLSAVCLTPHHSLRRRSSGLPVALEAVDITLRSALAMEAANGSSLRAREKIADRGGDFVAMRLKRKVTGVEETHFRAWSVALDRLRARRQEEGVVVAPNRQKRRFVLAEIGLEFWVHGDVALIVAEEIELNFMCAGTRQVEIVERKSVRRYQGRVGN